MHYTLIVSVPEGCTLEELMEPYSQDKEVDPYWGDEVGDIDINYFCEFYKVERKDFESAYNELGEDWNGNCWMKDSYGVLRERCTYNPKQEWDWYVVGGRWENSLQLKDGSFCNRAKKKDIANLKDIVTYAVLIDDEWIVTDTKEDTYARLKDLDDNVELVLVDYHW